MDFETSKNVKSEIVKQLIENPRQFSDILYVKRRVGIFRRRLPLESEIEGLINQNGICCLAVSTNVSEEDETEACRKAEVSILGEAGKVSVPYQVEVDDRVYIMKENPLIDPRADYSHKPPTSFNKILENVKLMKSCMYTKFEYSYLGCDVFTNEMLVSYFLQTLTQGYQGFMYHIGNTICASEGGNIGLSLMPKADAGTLYNFFSTGGDHTMVAEIEGREYVVVKPDIVIDCIKQVMVSLQIAQRFEFNHGDLKSPNILVSNKETIVGYDGVTSKSKYRYQITDFDKSSITVNSKEGHIRIFNENPFARRYLWLSPFKPMIYDHFGEKYYVIEGWMTWQIYALMRHMGFPFYASFDTYSFIISILSIRYVYDSFMVGNELNEIFRTLFFRDDWMKVLNKVEKMGKKNNQSIADIIGTLKGIKLKCNATQLLMKVLART